MAGLLPPDSSCGIVTVRKTPVIRSTYHPQEVVRDTLAERDSREPQ